MAAGVAAPGTAELAYLGDAVFELLVRERLLGEGIAFSKLSDNAKNYVSAIAQSDMYHRIFPKLSMEEQAVIKRGRNLHSTSRAKNANVAQYRHATGLETLFGHLYYMGQGERLKEVFDMCIGDGP